MFTDTINKCATNAARIVRLNKDNPFGFWISSAMAGAYVGLGIILIFTLGNMVEPALRPLLMGATFGIALTLVIIAGSELFTGHTMFLTDVYKRQGTECADNTVYNRQRFARHAGNVGKT